VKGYTLWCLEAEGDECILWHGCGLWTWRCKSHVGSCRSPPLRRLQCQTAPPLSTPQTRLRAKSYTMVVDALTNSSSPLLFMSIGQHSLFMQEKTLFPRDRGRTRFGFDSLGRTWLIFTGLSIAELSPAHLLSPSPLAPLSRYPCRCFSAVMAMC
jgi:hypothetical protein